VRFSANLWIGNRLSEAAVDNQWTRRLVNDQVSVSPERADGASSAATAPVPVTSVSFRQTAANGLGTNDNVAEPGRENREVP
jgi:hypothetical protein